MKLKTKSFTEFRNKNAHIHIKELGNAINQKQNKNEKFFLRIWYLGNVVPLAIARTERFARDTLAKEDRMH